VKGKRRTSPRFGQRRTADRPAPTRARRPPASESRRSAAPASPATAVKRGRHAARNKSAVPPTLRCRPRQRGSGRWPGANMLECYHEQQRTTTKRELALPCVAARRCGQFSVEGLTQADLPNNTPSHGEKPHPALRIHITSCPRTICVEIRVRRAGIPQGAVLLGKRDWGAVGPDTTEAAGSGEDHEREQAADVTVFREWWRRAAPSRTTPGPSPRRCRR